MPNLWVSGFIWPWGIVRHLVERAITSWGVPDLMGQLVVRLERALVKQPVLAVLPPDALVEGSLIRCSFWISPIHPRFHLLQLGTKWLHQRECSILLKCWIGWALLWVWVISSHTSINEPDQGFCLFPGESSLHQEINSFLGKWLDD